MPHSKTPFLFPHFTSHKPFYIFPHCRKSLYKPPLRLFFPHPLNHILFRQNFPISQPNSLIQTSNPQNQPFSEGAPHSIQLPIFSPLLVKTPYFSTASPNCSIIPKFIHTHLCIPINQLLLPISLTGNIPMRRTGCSRTNLTASEPLNCCSTTLPTPTIPFWLNFLLLNIILIYKCHFKEYKLLPKFSISKTFIKLHKISLKSHVPNIISTLKPSNPIRKENHAYITPRYTICSGS